MKKLILSASIILLSVPIYARDPTPYSVDATVSWARFVLGYPGAVSGTFSVPSFAGLPSGTNVDYHALITIRNLSTGQVVLQDAWFWTWTFGMNQWQVGFPWSRISHGVLGNQYLEVCVRFQTRLTYPDGTTEYQVPYMYSCKSYVQVEVPISDGECTGPVCDPLFEKTSGVARQDVFLQWRDQYDVFSNPESPRYLSVELFDKAFENYLVLANEPHMDWYQLGMANKSDQLFADGFGLDQSSVDVQVMDPSIHFGRLFVDMADGRPMPPTLIEEQLIFMADLQP